MSIKVGTVPSDLPLSTKPPVASISILERPVLLFQVELAVADLPNCSFFCWPESWEAATRTKFTTSPVWWPAAWVKVMPNCAFELGKLVAAPREPLKVPRTPELEPLTCQV